jgi:phosphoglycerol transferase
MKNVNPATITDVIAPEDSLYRIVLREWIWLTTGAALLPLIANLVLLGWPHGLLPQLSAPYVNEGDALLSQIYVQRSIEGWIWNDPRQGWPFGSALYDFPGSDAGNYLAFKLLAPFAHTAWGVPNLYFLAGFSASFVAAFVVLRALRVRQPYAAMAAFLFTFAPYHFSRLFYGHLLYTCYFTVPLFFYYGVRVLYAFDVPFEVFSRRAVPRMFVLTAVLSSFGVYFAFFGLVVIALFALLGSARSGGWSSARAAASIFTCVCLGVGFNLAPALINRVSNGGNPEVAARLPFESEFFALKLVHLLLPQPDHRVAALARFTKNYIASFPLSYTVATIGFVGTAGLIVIFVVWVRSMVGRGSNVTLKAISAVVVALIIIAGVGGINVVFALLVTPMIRAWDRISIFVDFGVLAALALTLNEVQKRPLAIASCLAVIGFLDQTPSSYRALTDAAAARWRMDTTFISQIETVVPRNAGIYVLPYFEYPEAGPKNNLAGYQLANGFLISKHLAWSYGGVAGRPGDLMFRALATQPASVQLLQLRKLGFSGVYIDLRGYKDHGAEIVKEFSEALSSNPTLTRADGNVVFFKVSTKTN